MNKEHLSEFEMNNNTEIIINKYKYLINKRKKELKDKINLNNIEDYEQDAILILIEQSKIYDALSLNSNNKYIEEVKNKLDELENKYCNSNVCLELKADIKSQVYINDLKVSLETKKTLGLLDNSKIIRDALMSLPEREQLIYKLLYIDRHSTESAAFELGIKMATFISHHYDLKAKLLALLPSELCDFKDTSKNQITNISTRGQKNRIKHILKYSTSLYYGLSDDDMKDYINKVNVMEDRKSCILVAKKMIEMNWSLSQVSQFSCLPKNKVYNLLFKTLKDVNPTLYKKVQQFIANHERNKNFSLNKK